MTKAEENQCAEMMAQEVIKIINLFGAVLHKAKAGCEDDDKKPSAT